MTGRIAALALDPSDTTGNHLYVGTTGGGVWVSQNAGASTTSSVTFTPLTDSLGALSGMTDASISIGALTVQPGGTGVILAGTGDPNDALDSYYGAGILRSTDGGNTWSLIQSTVDLESGLSNQDYSFVGEGFAGFAWSTVNPQLVVAAVSQAYEGTLVDADRTSFSYEGLYYSTDGGATWHLSTITDGGGEDVQGPAYGLVPAAAGWECRDFSGVEPGAAIVCGGGALPRVLPVAGRGDLDADDGSARHEPDHGKLPEQSGRYWFRSIAPSFAERWR